MEWHGERVRGYARCFTGEAKGGGDKVLGGAMISGCRLLQEFELVVQDDGLKGTAWYPPVLVIDRRDLSARWGSICSAPAPVGSFDMVKRTDEQGPPLLRARGIGNVSGRR